MKTIRRVREGAKARRSTRGRIQKSFLRASFAPSRLCVLFILSIGAIAQAAPKLEEVFKSTQENFVEESSGGKFLAWICATIGMLIVLSIAHRRWERRSAKPKVLNNQSKLIRQLQKQISLKNAEVRQLKVLAESQSVQNPLTLLLCPSVLVKAARENPAKVDRGVISSMIKRLG